MMNQASAVTRSTFVPSHSTIATVKVAVVECDGTNVLRVTADA